VLNIQRGLAIDKYCPVESIICLFDVTNSAAQEQNYNRRREASIVKSTTNM